MQVFAYVQELPRWKIKEGRDFIFFEPFTESATGRSSQAWQQALCHELRGAVQLIPDSYARRYCQEQGGLPDRTIIVPHVRPLHFPTIIPL